MTPKELAEEFRKKAAESMAALKRASWDREDRAKFVMAAAAYSEAAQMVEENLL